MANIFKQIGRTIEGKTGVGKILHQVLPAKKLRSAVGSAVLGIKKASPLPEIKDLAIKEDVTIASQKLGELTGNGDQLDQATKINDLTPDQILSKVNEVRDILDNGKLDDSVDDLSPKTKKLIAQAFSALPLVAYLIYGVTTGDFTLSGFLEYLRLFLGI